MATMKHVRYLSETIGPRGSTTIQEAEAARYVAQVLQKAGLEPSSESFTSTRSAWTSYAPFSGLVLVGILLFWLGGRAGRVGP